MKKCCENCIKMETSDCPIKEASPWSRWDHCCNFKPTKESEDSDILAKKLLEQMAAPIIEFLKQNHTPMDSVVVTQDGLSITTATYFCPSNKINKGK